jgi:hypothetical protein
MTENVNLTIHDIANAVAIIDICVKRGAIEGSELSPVGAVRDKLAKFVELNKPSTPEETTEKDAE